MEDLELTVRAPVRVRAEQRSCPELRTRSYVDPAVSISELYHLAPAWYPVPPRSAMQRVLVYVVPEPARHVALLGPGVTLTRLDLPRSPSPAPIAAPHYVAVLPLILAVRQAPAAYAPVVDWLARGTELRVDGQRGVWLAVTLSNHAHGYVPRRDVMT